MDTGRKRFDAIRGRSSAARPPVVAVVDALAARVSGVSPDALARDATAFANGLSRTAELLGLDAVVVGFDFDLTREALDGGAPDDVATRGRLGIAIETADRLFRVSRATRGCIAAMVGPVTLAAQLFGEDAALERAAELKPIESAIAKAWCETRPDLLLLLERAPFARSGIGPLERRAYNALRNIAAYYDVAPALWVEDWAPERADGLDALGIEFLVPVPAPADAARIPAPGLGVAVPFETPGTALARAREAAASARARVFFMSRGAVPADVPIETVADLVRDLRGLRGGAC